MSFFKKPYRQIANDILTQICGGEITEECIYVKSKNLYKLSNTPVTEVKLIEGTLNGTEKKLFAKDSDYRLVDDFIEWLGEGAHPDDNTVFTVQYLFTRPSGISDTYPGSVLRTIVEAISREIEYFYMQMERAYLSGFLDTANGNGLDLVVSIMGIKRKPPQPSSGLVTFGNRQPEILSVTDEVYVFDGSLEYPLNKRLIKEISKIQGTSRGSVVTFEKDADYSLEQNNIRWLPEGRKPDIETAAFQVDYSAYQEIIIPKGATVATRGPKPEDTRLFTTIEEMPLALTKEGKWEADVHVICTTPGRFGNVLAGTVVVMPQPVMGVEYVVNKGDISNGVEAETDDDLRERTKHILESAGKATYSSLETAIKSVKGVKSLLIKDMPDNKPGTVKVIVDGGDMTEIKRVIDNTRAAGVKVDPVKPKIVHVNASLTLMLEKNANERVAVTEAEKRIRSYISTLTIGDHVLYSRLVELLMGIEGIWDIRALKMTAHREDGSIIESEMQNIEISSEEKAEPRTINLTYEKRK